jgi:hypothetical protein
LRFVSFLKILLSPINCKLFSYFSNNQFECFTNSQTHVWLARISGPDRKTHVLCGNKARQSIVVYVMFGGLFQTI